MKELFQGKPFRHPVHTWLVHFPIGLFMLSFALDLYTWFRDFSSTVVEAAYYSMAVGVVMALVAAVFGLVDYLDIRRDHPGKATATWHMLINIVVILLYLVNTYARAEHVDEMKTPLPLFLMSLAGVSLISLSGYLGGRMVYDEGISVGRHRRTIATPSRTIHVNTTEKSNARGKEGKIAYYFVAPAERLEKKQILRVAIGGYVAMIAKLGEEIYAVQDFCTHRSGPLSEGQVCEGQVQCPWHNSRFDLKTGKVTQGPAKVELKTFPVRVKENEIQLGIEADESQE